MRSRRLSVWSCCVVVFALILLVGTTSASPAAGGEPDTAGRVTRASASGFPGGPHFRLGCRFSHMNNDDPIVYPAAPGRSHNHTFIGNFVVDAYTTPSSLLGGRTSCDFDADSSAYWMPTLFVGRRAILPFAGFVYYIRRTSTPVAPLPAGLKMIAGNSMARRPQSKEIVAWSCGELGARPRYSAIPVCARGGTLQLQVIFPNCWNGTTTDSPNHKRHMAYASAGRCPVTHPVAVPTIALIVLYPNTPPRGQVASGKYAMHADFMNGWDQATLAQIVAEQLN